MVWRNKTTSKQQEKILSLAFGTKPVMPAF